MVVTILSVVNIKVVINIKLVGYDIAFRIKKALIFVNY